MEQSYIWVKAAIDSCTNEFQLECCRTLIKLFEDMYGEGSLKKVDELWKEMVKKAPMLLI